MSPNDFVVVGNIGDRWRAMGAENGPLGPPIGPEQDVPGQRGRRQTFQRGEMAWSPDQGTNMVVAVYQQDDYVIVNWGDSSPFNYQFWIVHWDKDGQYAGQETLLTSKLKLEPNSNVDPTFGFWCIPTFYISGTYTVSIEGCDEGSLGGSDCKQGWTIPVSVHYVPPPPLDSSPHPCQHEAVGLIHDRWMDLGGANGPLGCPITDELAVPGRNGRSSTFEHGQIVWSPDQGPNMVVAVYQQDNNIVVNWGDTTPYHYDLFLVRFDKDGYNFLQEGPPFTHSRLAGSYSIPAPGVGTYTVIVEGCDGSDNVDCKQGWTIPASVHYTLLSSGNATPSCPHEAVGLIHDRWMDLGGADGPLGCPITDELAVPGRNGRSSTFEHGQIVWSPDQGPNMVVAVYQQDNNIVVDWGPTLPYHYNFWIARWDKDGQNVGQQDICKSGEPACQFVTPTGGTWNVPLSDADRAAAHTYTVVIEGCDEATFGSDCKQGWTIPASVQYEPPSPSPYVIDLSSAGATTPLLARLTIPKRAKVVSSYNACRGKVLGEVVGDEGDFMVVAIAKLYMAELAMRFHTPRGCPGSLVDFRSEVNDAIRKLGQEPSYTGSSSDRIPCRRRGEYDVALKGYIIMMYRFHDLLDPDVRFRILHLLTKNGPYDPDDESYCSPINIPETENHLLLIHTSRYLTNQLLYNAYKDEGPLYQTYHIDHYNNNANGMTTFMLQYLRVFLMGDFKEYNARPYQHYSAAALQNLYDFAQDQSVKTAAQMVLDYISAKFAVSSNFLRRSAPFRRRASHYATNLLDQRSDAQTNRFLLLTGMTQILGEVKPVLHAHQGARDDMQLLAASTYQAPDMILDLIMNQDHRHFYQRIRHEGVEIYSSERDFLISAGGFWMGSPYSVAGGEDPDDQGVAIPTTLMPTGEGTDLQQFVRIDGAGTVPADDNGDGTVYTVENGNRIPQRNRVNTGVAPHFACGINPVIPDAYLPQDKPDCYRVVGPWTFLDHSSESCVGRRDYGFYAAVFRARTGNTSYGFFEARGRHESQGLSFEQFVETVQAQNSDRQFAYGAVNVYTTSTGRDIKFEFNPPGDNKYIWPILSTGDPNIDQTLDRGLPSWPLAQGDVINSDGPGRITIDNPFLGKRLVLDHRDSLRPKRIETSIHGHVGAGDIPVPGDYDGDGIIDSAFWRPGEGTWHIQPSSGGLTRIDHFGQVGDYPVPADYDHDGKTDLAVWRPSDGTWYVQPSSGGPIWQRTTGRDGAIVVPSDHDGLFILARTLVVLAQQLAAAGQTSEAAEPARGGIGIFLRLAPQVSDALVLDIVWQVGINSGYLPPAEAVEPVQQVVVLAQQLADRNPTNTDYQYRHAWSLVVLAQRLEAANRRPEAETPARTAIGIFLRLAPQVSDALVLDIVWQVGINSGYLPPAEAVEPVQQVVVLAQQLADRNPTNTEYRDRLMWIRNVLTQRLAAASHDR